MSVVARIAGALVGGAGTYACLVLVSPELSPALRYGAAGVMATLGAVFGPKIWQVVVELF